MEGINEAKKRGVKFGRSKIEIPKEFYNLAEKYCKNETSLRKASKVLGVSHTTVQAAIGSVALSNGLDSGMSILSIAVLGIIITAPLGAILIDKSYKKLLRRALV